MKSLKFINDRVIKKVLAKEDKNIRNYVARIISEVTNIPYKELENNLELVYPEIGYKARLVNSEADIVYKDDKMYFNIEINYSTSKTQRIKNDSYT